MNEEKNISSSPGASADKQEETQKVEAKKPENATSPSANDRPPPKASEQPPTKVNEDFSQQPQHLTQPLPEQLSRAGETPNPKLETPMEVHYHGHVHHEKNGKNTFSSSSCFSLPCSAGF